MNGQINISRFIAKLDSCFDRNDLKAAKECIEYWEKEARETGDDRALLTVLNEAVGFYRRTQKRGRALAAMEESLTLVDKLGLPDKLSGATIYINAATTLSFFGKEEEGLQLYGY
ncbi:MAG: tetratricopeptide repeat protein [Christensenellaceae bacterium]